MTLNLFSVGFLLATEPIILILSLYLWTRRGVLSPRFKLFRNFVTFCTLACTTEIFYATLVNLRFSMPAIFYQSLYSLNLCLGMATILSLYLYFTQFVTSYGWERKVFRVMRYIDLTLFTILIIVNVFTNCIAAYNTVGRLRRGPLFDVATYVLPIWFIVIIAIMAVLYRRQFDRRMAFSFVGVLVATLIVTPIRMTFFPYMQMEYFSLGMLGVVMFFVLETPAYKQLLSTGTRMEEARRAFDHATEEALKASRAKSDFLSNMSHEIRTPMNAIIGMNDMILRETADETIRSYATDIRTSGRHLLNVINDILDYSRIESGKMEIREAAYRLSMLLESLEEEAAPLAAEKNLSLLFDVDTALPDHLLGDETHIAQVVKNLIANGIKYTEEGSVRLTVNGIRRDRLLTLFFKISDTGIGIRKESQAEIWNSFSRINMEKNRTILGTGLGLAITKDLVNRMHGEIFLRSEEGKGSTFTVRIPQHIVQEETIAQSRRHQALQNQDVAGTFTVQDAAVLLVDDNRTNLRVSAMLLKAFGIEADTVASGAECLIACESRTYDMVFLDHRMPGMDGVETLQALRRLPSFNEAHTIVISLTASDDDDARERYIGLGFDDYLVKPVEVTRLKEVLRQFLPREKIHVV